MIVPCEQRQRDVGDLHSMRMLGVLHQLRPNFTNFFCTQLAELGGRAGLDLDALVAEQFDHVGIAQDLHDVAVGAVERRLGDAGGHLHAEPHRHVVAGDAGLGDRGHVRQQRRAPGAGDGDRLELAGLDLLHRRWARCRTARRSRRPASPSRRARCPCTARASASCRSST